MNFYVYEWYRESDNYIFYVGKGCKRRKGIKSNRNVLFEEFISENKCSNRIIFETDDENEAYLYEYNRINELKQRGQASCNIRVELGIGSKTTSISNEQINRMVNDNPMKDEKQRLRMSINNPMKDPEQRKRMSEFNPMKNPETVQKLKDKLSKIIIIGEMRFKGWKEASSYFGVTSNNIGHWLKNGKTPKKYGSLECKYDDQQPSQENVNNCILEGSETND